MGLTFADIQSLSREGTALYPPVQQPVMEEYTEDEKRIAALQMGFSARLQGSAYYVVETTKSDDLPRYSDRYRQSEASQPTLKRKDLHAPFFPPELLEDYFNPGRKRRNTGAAKLKRTVNLDKFDEGDEEKEGSEKEGSQVGSDAEQDDYDVDEEYDNDYAENYFDNGEGDDADNLGDGGGGDDVGGGGDYD
ncbi:hypothetical protein K523DRAFT_360677 [Schizophyllum commune Tattone D]|nr:hypothetical protein K523DRAFT_360677 [Schizophyllum commune Tattone D]